VVLGWTSTRNVYEETQPSCRDKVSGWWLAGPASDFIVRDVGCIWNTQDMTEAPLVESIDSSTGGGHHTPRVCRHHRGVSGVCIHIVKSDLGVQTNGGTPNVTIESLHASAGHLDPPAYISFTSSGYVNARSKIDKRVDNRNLMTKYRHTQQSQSWKMSAQIQIQQLFLLRPLQSDRWRITTVSQRMFHSHRRTEIEMMLGNI